jgi:hemoglobin
MTIRRVLILASLIASSLFATRAHATTLFDEIGGEPKLKAVVEELTAIALEDERINFAFAGTDLARFKLLLYTQLCELAAGPCIYDGRSMSTAHSKLNITTAQFNALAEDLYKAFDRVGISYRTQNKMMALLAPMQKDVVKR